MQRWSTLFSTLNLFSAVAVIVYAVYLLRLHNGGGLPANVAISRPFAVAAVLGFANLFRCLGSGEIRLGGAGAARAVQPRLYWGALLVFAVACSGVATVAWVQW